jgi:NSS family neurotransmitter:Na+ symporter
MSETPLFKSKLGLIAATVGSAVGLGTVWRFPAETQANGGAAFLLVYTLCIFVLGVPIMLSEFALGRSGRGDAVGAFARLSPRSAWVGTGYLAVLASYLILVFYMVVGGWTIEYLFNSITGDLYQALPAAHGSTEVMDTMFIAKMRQYVETPWPPLIATLLVIAMTIGVLLGGVQKGIERLSNIMMPLLFVLLVAFCCITLSLPGAGEGVRFFLHPDFSKIDAGVVINALGQALFSLSLGMGILITYAAYYPSDTRLVKTSVTVSSLTLLIAILMGFLIFPAVTSFGLADHQFGGTTLVFVTLPEVFMNLPATRLWSSLFFLLLFMGALTSIVSIAEVSVAFVAKRFNLSRAKAVWYTLLPMFVLSAICSLSFSTLSHFTIFGRTIFDFLDNITNNYMLPMVAFFGCVYVGWVAPRNLVRDELTNYGSLKYNAFDHVVKFIIKWLAPIAILVILLSNVF